MTKVAVVILNYNGEKLLPQFLPSVVRHSADAVVYVADNASTDQSVLILEKDFPSVRIIRLDANYGFCKGYNEALKQVDARIIILLNSDVEVTPGWLNPMIRLFDRDPNIAAIQPKILSHTKRNTFEYAGAGGGFIDALGYPFCRGRIFEITETDTGQYDDERPVFWASGACMAIRSTTFHQFEGFDEDFFAHMEEIDLCWKIQRSGQQVYYTGQSTVYHLGAGTLAYNNPRKVFLNFRNNLSMLCKHFTRPELLLKLPLRMTLDWLAGVVFLIKGHPENTIAIFKAHIAFLRNIHHNLSKRRALQKVYPKYSRAQIFGGTILLNRNKGKIIPASTQ